MFEGLHWLVGSMAGEGWCCSYNPGGIWTPTLPCLLFTLSLALSCFYILAPSRLHSLSVRLPCSPSPQVHPIEETHARHMDPETINTQQSPALPGSAIRIKLSCLYFFLSRAIFSLFASSFHLARTNKKRNSRFFCFKTTPCSSFLKLFLMIK